MSTNNDFVKDEDVIYVPNHAKGDVFHPDCDAGRVVRTGNDGVVFVSFYRNYFNELSEPKACNFSNLVKI